MKTDLLAMKTFFLLLICCATSFTKAQNGVLLIPFEDKMYRSALDKELGAFNNKSHYDLMSSFKKGLMIQLELAFRRNYTPLSLLAVDSLSKASLTLCYNSTGLEYIPVKTLTAEKENSQPGDKLRAAFSKSEKHKTSPTQSGIYNGELVTVEDSREKFMNTVVHNPQLFNALKAAHETSIFVFINEFDLLKKDADSPFVQQSAIGRVIKVHYTVFNDKGKEICSGIAETEFPGKKNKLDEIITDHLSEIAAKIYRNILNSEETLLRLEQSQSMENR